MKIALLAEPVDQPTNLGLSSGRYKIVRAVANATLQKFNEGNDYGAYEEYISLKDMEEREALWSILRPHPACRRALKLMREQEIEGEKRLQA
jgi:hypothetical protein